MGFGLYRGANLHSLCYNWDRTEVMIKMNEDETKTIKFECEGAYLQALQRAQRPVVVIKPRSRGVAWVLTCRFFSNDTAHCLAPTGDGRSARGCTRISLVS